jgi:hypothetical protein
MSRLLIATCAMSGLLGLALPAPGQEKGRPPGSPVLVAKGKEYLVHFLPDPAFGTTFDVLHTTPSTGEMKALLRSGPNTLLLGYAADRDRLYVAARVDVGWGSYGFPPARVVDTRFRVYAFWLADGTELACKEMKESDVPEKLRKGKPVAEGGPIELAEGGARCFGASLKFDGKKVLEPPPVK